MMKSESIASEMFPDDVDLTKSCLLSDARRIIDTARANAVRSVDFNRVLMYWNLGRRIFEEEQSGKDRADYGSYLTRNLARDLEPEYGSGFGVRQLEFCRKFYRVYPNANTLYSHLNWSQYKLLIAISEKEKREYYELEALHNGWTKRELERQINSLLWERLLLSNDKDSVLELSHQDLGQLQLYVNWFDRYEKTEEENKTIGILLCTDKNDTAVKIALPEDNETILAAKYKLHLPNEAQLLAEVRKIEAEYESTHEESDMNAQKKNGGRQ